MNAWLRIAVLGFAVTAAGTARAAISAQISDDCTRTGYSISQLPYSHTDFLPGGWMVWDVYLQPGTPFFACARRSLIILGSDGGSSGTVAVYSGTNDALRNYFQANDEWLRPSAIVNFSGVCYMARTGMADAWHVGNCTGKPAQPLYGWYLADAPTAYITYQVGSGLPRGSPVGQLFLPFRVASTGSGGWVSIAYKGQQFWRQSLAALSAGRWYQANVPMSLLNGADPVFTIQLESTGAVPASIFVPTNSMLAVDTDKDGFMDASDNCITAWNPSQRDSDRDNFGNRCDADLNQTGLVTTLDYALLRSRLNTADPNADLDESGRVTTTDYTILRTLLNKAPGPSGLVP